MDSARLSLIQRREETQDRLRLERERLSTRAWWRRPTSLSTSSWVRSGGARATTTPTAPASRAAWPTLEASMLAQRGDDPEEMEIEVEETRTIRLLDRTETEVDQDGARGEMDDDRERTRAEGRGRGKDAKKRERDEQ